MYEFGFQVTVNTKAKFLTLTFDSDKEIVLHLKRIKIFDENKNFIGISLQQRIRIKGNLVNFLIYDHTDSFGKNQNVKYKEVTFIAQDDSTKKQYFVRVPFDGNIADIKEITD